jgi:eukaryotic-like serine/threonine-protein kinase
MPQRRLLAVLQRHPVLFWSFGGALALLLLLNYVVMPLYVNHGSRLTVPNVVGLTLPQAHGMLDTATLVAVEAETRPDPALPAGTVVHQNPPAGSVVKEGRHIYLTISGGEIQVIVPLLRGRSLREARFTLERHGLQLGDINFTPSDQFPENTIIDQSIGAEAHVTKGTHVAITVSRGRAADQSTIPLLIGKTVAEAERLLTAAGLRVGNVTYQPSFDLIPNTVVDQYPRAGEPAKSGDAVDLFVVKVGRPAEEIKVPGKE